MNMNLLAGSVGGGGDADDLGWGGEDPGVEPDAPELPGMPDFSPNKLLGFPFSTARRKAFHINRHRSPQRNCADYFF